MPPKSPLVYVAIPFTDGNVDIDKITLHKVESDALASFAAEGVSVLARPSGGKLLSGAAGSGRHRIVGIVLGRRAK